MTIALKTVPELSRGHDKQAVSRAYNEAGDRYQAYADGSLERLYAFDGQYSFGDEKTWSVIEERLHRLRLSGARSLRILDLGCGPGTWMLRTVSRAHQMGFTDITARGIDLSDLQIQRARSLWGPLAGRADVHLAFQVGDIRDRLPEENNSVDLCLCLYGVLNHLGTGELRPLMREIARVTSGAFIATVRTVGSTPTIYVESLSAARSFYQNNMMDRLDVQFQNGKCTSFSSHLFSQGEIRSLMKGHMKIEDMRGLDLFHGRFSRDPRWNPARATATDGFISELDALEARYDRDPEFMDHATHLLLVGTPVA
jgi:SAM-dependent methyltransferase